MRTLFQAIAAKPVGAKPLSRAALLRALLGGSCSILILLLLGKWSQHIWIMAPFGASCVLLFAVSQSPLAQPRNVLLGHLLTTFIGLCLLKLFGSDAWCIALAVGLSIVAMQLLHCVHPPAGANPLLILMTASQVDYGWDFLLFPVLTGALTLLLIAYVVNNVGSDAAWPNPPSPNPPSPNH
ncbi:HPP family protein [Acinetobacter larvae]|uniref:HPP family protein n=1 Tax=Acinetobacter larvae TaxID=1789224 RepID=A0A1B2LXJ3_9GAMM|nr:HPP family protein [Acinetobacter larvae]AOA57645.1 HPP family protein [Acinetobacter larvae]